MKKLGLDFDGTLYDWHFAVYEYYKLHKNYQGSETDFWTDYYKTIPEDEFNFITQIDFLYASIPPDSDCKQFLESVKDKYEIYYLTARPPLVRTTTEQYVRRYKYPSRDNLIFTTDKVNTARLLGLDFMIEDMPNQVEALSKVVFTIMRARPWNKHIWYEYPTITKLMQSFQFLEA